jgi:hypothetical protein
MRGLLGRCVAVVFFPAAWLFAWLLTVVGAVVVLVLVLMGLLTYWTVRLMTRLMPTRRKHAYEA